VTELDVTAPGDAAATAAGQLRRSQTAEIVCAQRAAETRRLAAERLIDDPYARLFLTNGLYRSLCATRPSAWLTRSVFDRLYPGYMAIVLLRNRWHEELLQQSLTEAIQQIVLLGAGLDSTALRLDLGAATVYEVDAGPTQQAKREAIARAGLAPRTETRYVECDFERESLPDRLGQAGFDPSARAYVAWWGVSFFLTAGAVGTTMTDVASLTAPGSRFAFDYLEESVVEGTTTFPGAARARAAVARRGEPYRFGLSRDRAAQFVSAYGFTVEHNLSMPDLASRCGGQQRFPYSTDDFFGVITGRREHR
jgi:methyltransferase (TIGR00027 family)